MIRFYDPFWECDCWGWGGGGVVGCTVVYGRCSGVALLSVSLTFYLLD